MGNYKFKKLIATLMATAMLTFPTLQAFANDPFSDNQKAFDVIDTKYISESSKNSSGKHVITLITGDVVTVTYIEGGKSVISVEAADYGSGGTSIMTLGKDTYVIPDEAMSYIASDFLDKNLFNITALIADGYDDENQSTLPVIVQYAPTNARFEKALPTTLAGSERTHILESIDGVAVSTDKEQTRAFWEDITENAAADSRMTGGIKKVWLDGRVEVNLAESVPQVGAPEAWESGFDGKGITVAVLDTGIDPEHPDLVNQIDEIESFVPEEDALDYHGHGTHVASTVLGTGDALEGQYKGVAPGARLIVGKVLSSSGYGQDSWVIDGMEWAAHNAKVVNMSLGDPQPSDGTDPMSQAVNNLSEETGALFVIASGNAGTEGIGSPGAADAALTVGSVDKSDMLSWFSTKGPRFMDAGLKPDLVAPGSDIIAARSQYASQGDGLYLGLSGTSMATPHVTGAAAILSQRYPDWTGDQLKSALMSTTKMLDDIKPYEGGAGRLDVATAASSTIYAKGSLDFGFFKWPHDEEALVEKTVSYTNVSDQPVTLDLTATFTDKTGNMVDEDLLQLSTDQVIIPANESAEVTVTVDPSKATEGSRYQGQLTAKVEGQIVAHTAMVMGKEEERFSLTINATNREGAPASTMVSIVGPNKNPGFLNVQGTTELRLPKGTYSVMTMMDVDTNTDHAGVALLGDPEVILDGPKIVELDARNAREFTANVPEKTEAKFRKLEYYRSFSEIDTITATYLLPETIDKMYAEPTATVSTGEFQLNTRWRLIKPVLSINVNELELDSLTLPGSQPLEGKHQLDVVFAKQGTQEDYKGLDVKDKAVIVQRSNMINGSERAAAAHAAGAKLLVIVNDRPTEFLEWVGKEDSLDSIPIAVASVSETEGIDLIKLAKEGHLKINVEGTPDTPYVYDLMDNHQNAIPEDLTYSPTANELVKINAQYYSDRSAPGAEFRWDIPSYSENGVGYPNKLSLPSVRTEWVSASEVTMWYHQARVDDEWEVRQPLMSYQQGQRLDEKWFAPVVRPRFGEGFWVPVRFENDLIFNVPSLADSGDGNTGWDISSTGEQKLKLYQGANLVETSSDQIIILWEAPEEKTEFRLVNDVTRDPNRWNTSVSTHTEWTIWTEMQEEFESFLPMISLDYKVDTDMKGNAIAGDTIKLGLSASQIDYASGNGNIEGASLEVSFDEGKTWEEVQLIREGDGWTANISNASKRGTFVSLRASAWDDLGNRIDQTVIKAFGVSESEVTLSTDKLDYSLTKGTTSQMKVKAVTTPKQSKMTEEDVTNKATYVVEDDTVASVTNGLITAKAKGSTKVTISYGGNEVTVNITVTEPAVDPGPGGGGGYTPPTSTPTPPVQPNLCDENAKSGCLQVNKATPMYILENNRLKKVGEAVKGKSLPVKQTISPMLGLGGDIWLERTEAISYETPSKEMIAKNQLPANKRPKQMWKGLELNPGQIGKVTIIKDTVIWQSIDKTTKLPRVLKKGEQYRVYRYVPGMYQISDLEYIVQDSNVVLIKK
ncbi:peptidase [Psychrobacillus glaciei]|uniref:Peptidase n=1 Tax=Psychrobacillus glaciei TaxID=2283160 RepID=A0A5J6SPM1_9BACI|nr:S8 family serine peptidase [Psychrobacillus glaciei]QFF98087.1 peptidase [Psychrobacillus glaciei]